VVTRIYLSRVHPDKKKRGTTCDAKLLLAHIPGTEYAPESEHETQVNVLLTADTGTRARATSAAPVVTKLVQHLLCKQRECHPHGVTWIAGHRK
jgi:hypothetical protein